MLVPISEGLPVPPLPPLRLDVKKGRLGVTGSASWTHRPLDLRRAAAAEAAEPAWWRVRRRTLGYTDKKSPRALLCCSVPRADNIQYGKHCIPPVPQLINLQPRSTQYRTQTIYLEQWSGVPLNIQSTVRVQPK